MIPDHDCVPGLERPVTVSEYAQLEGLSETLVLTLIQQLKLRKAAYFRGQWFIEAPRNSEARLAQLRSQKAEAKKEGSLTDWVRGLAAEARERTQSVSQPQRDPINPSKLFALNHRKRPATRERISQK
jgi:hypothetical protein